MVTAASFQAADSAELAACTASAMVKLLVRSVAVLAAPSTIPGPAALREGGRNRQLYTSSFTMALAVHAASLGRNRLLGNDAAVDHGLGGGFLVIKDLNTATEYRHHLCPFSILRFTVKRRRSGIVMVFYFFITLVHAAHMLIGLGFCRGFLGEQPPSIQHGLSHARRGIGLYWHFVDIVWIFVFDALFDSMMKNTHANSVRTYVAIYTRSWSSSRSPWRSFLHLGPACIAAALVIAGAKTVLGADLFHAPARLQSACQVVCRRGFFWLFLMLCWC